MKNFFGILVPILILESGYCGLENIWRVYDPLKVITFHKNRHHFPNWVNETLWSKISEMYNLWSQYHYTTDLLKRLQGGELWKGILERLESLTKEHSIWKEKMYAYSAHDETLTVLLNMFGMKLSNCPPYTALVLLETHRINNQFILQLYYKNTTDSNQIYQFPIAYCDGICTVEKLKKATSNFISVDLEMECDPSIVYKKIKTFVLSLSIISIVAIICCLILKSYLKKGRMYRNRTILESDQDMLLLREDFIR